MAQAMQVLEEDKGQQQNPGGWLNQCRGQDSCGGRVVAGRAVALWLAQLRWLPRSGVVLWQKV